MRDIGADRWPGRENAPAGAFRQPGSLGAANTVPRRQPCRAEPTLPGTTDAGRTPPTRQAENIQTTPYRVAGLTNSPAATTANATKTQRTRAWLDKFAL
jgi:hypothetical protein